MPKHRAFNVDRYLDKFDGHEELIKGYCRLWGRRLDFSISSLTIPTFKEWLVQGDVASTARDELMEGLYRCCDLSTDHGHEDLKSACQDFPRYNPDPDETLPVECLALKIRTENEDAFNLAYARHSLFNAERFSIYRGASPRTIADPKKRVKGFGEALAKEFKRDKSSERVLVRFYREGDYTNFVVYHEKRMKSTLIFKGTKIKPKVAPTLFRPAQQDFVSYNEQTGQVEIEAAHDGEEEKLRKCFAKAFLGDADFFDGTDSAKCIELGSFAKSRFRLDAPEGASAVLVQLRFKLNQEGAPSFDIRSKDVFRTLELNGLRNQLKPELIQTAAVKIYFPGDNRGKRVELHGQNKIKFNRATHAEEVFRLLMEWGLLVTDEDAKEDGSAKAAFEAGIGPTARNGESTDTISRNRTAPTGGTATRALRRSR